MASINGLTKSYRASTALAAYSIVKFGAADFDVAQAAAAADLSVGVTTEIAVAIDETADVVLAGLAEVKLGGAVTRGQKVTSDAAGLGVAAAPAAGANVHVVGVAHASGVAGDIIPVHLSPGVMQG
jgi:hypothetical protein